MTRTLTARLSGGTATPYNGHGIMKTISRLQEWPDGQRRRRMVAEDLAGYATHPVRLDAFEGLVAAQAVEMLEPREGATQWPH